MNNNTLYIFDEQAKSKKFLDNCHGRSGKVFLCPITSNQEKIASVLEKLQSMISFQTMLIPFVRYFNKKAFSIRDDYIKFISDIGNAQIDGRKNLKEYFRCPFEQFSTWWFSLISEKNPLKSKSYHRLVTLLTILDLKNRHSCEEICLDINSKELTLCVINNANGKFTCSDLHGHALEPGIIYLLSHFIRTARDIAFTLRRVIFTKKVMRGLDNRNIILRNSEYLLITYFPLLSKKSAMKKRFVNKYYEPLQKALEKNYKGRFSWLGLDVTPAGLMWRDGIMLGRKVNEWDNCFFFCKEFLRAIDLLTIPIQYGYLSMKFLIKAHFLSGIFRHGVKKIDIWPLFRDDCHSSFCGWILIEGLLYYRIFTRALKKLKANSTVLYIAENLLWEKALNIAARKRCQIKTIGIQHTTVPLLLLNYFNDRTELQNENYIQSLPRPDYLGCTGNIPARLFLESGWGKNRVFVLGALRAQYLKHELERPVPWSRRKNKVIVALSIKPEESMEVLHYVRQAFTHCTDYEIIIKGHPFLALSELLISSNIKLDRNIFRIVETSLVELLPEAKALIVTGSSSALESIAHQCPVIIPRLSRVVDMNPLSGISSLGIYVESPKELKDAVDKIMQKGESPLSYSDCKTLVEDYWEFPDSATDFLRRIEVKI